jgi:hypothetical protein
VATTNAERRLTLFSAMPALNIALGVWVLASPYILQFTVYDAARISATAVGPFVVGFAITRLAVEPRWFWAGWVNVALGLWLLATPFLFGLFNVTDVLLNFVISGALIAIFAALGQFERVDDDRD